MCFPSLTFHQLTSKLLPTFTRLPPKPSPDLHPTSTKTFYRPSINFHQNLHPTSIKTFTDFYQPSPDFHQPSPDFHQNLLPTFHQNLHPTTLKCVCFYKNIYYYKKTTPTHHEQVPSQTLTLTFNTMLNKNTLANQ